MLIQKSDELGIEMNAKNENDHTGFNIVCENGHTYIAICYIDLNAKDSFGRTPFHFACRMGHLEVVSMLNKKSSKLNIKLNR